VKGIHISGEERQLLWALLQHDTIESVHSLVVGALSSGEKTARIVRQMDFIFQVRLVVSNTAASGGGIWLGDLATKYVIGILTETPSSKLPLESRALFHRHRDNLLFRLGDDDRASVGVMAVNKP